MTKYLWLAKILLATSLVVPLLAGPGHASPGEFAIARLKYRGGGDWYTDPTSMPNLLREVERTLGVKAARDEARISIMDESLFNYPFLYMTGHGAVEFSDEEAARLRLYLTSGGFLWADDCYGMDQTFRRELRKVFPDAELVELPFSHEIYSIAYGFPQGLPKVHEHAGGPPHGYGMVYQGRLVVFYSFNTDIGDGLEDADVHQDPAQIRQAAMDMATNIVAYALTH
ncbi:MAG TPA: DUF4159 domain-containing protein [bacterium]|nr:DUF4159 domain-containing protein [bacterium]